MRKWKLDKESKSIYNQLYRLSRQDHSPKRGKKERSNSKRSRAHRLDDALKTQSLGDLLAEKVAESMAPSVPITNFDRIKAIRGMLNMHEFGFISDQNLLSVIKDIVNGA